MTVHLIDVLSEMEINALSPEPKIVEEEKCPTHKPWGMYEFALSDPDDTLVRVGWPSRLTIDQGRDNG